jgi:hypothetical protein
LLGRGTDPKKVEMGGMGLWLGAGFCGTGGGGGAAVAKLRRLEKDVAPAAAKGGDGLGSSGYKDASMGMAATDRDLTFLGRDRPTSGKSLMVCDRGTLFFQERILRDAFVNTSSIDRWLYSLTARSQVKP